MNLVVLCSIVLSSLALLAQGGTVRVTVARANVRQTASERGAILSQITYGTELELRGVEGDWFRVLLPIGAMRVEAYLSRRVASLVAAPAGTPEAPSPPVPSRDLAPGMSVAADVGGRTFWLSAVATRVVPVAARPRTLSELAAGSGVDAAIAGGTAMPADPLSDVTWAWVVSRDRPALVLSAPRPAFFASYRDVPGIDLRELTPAVVKLVPAGAKWSLVAMARARADAATRDDADWAVGREVTQETVNVQIVAGAVGIMDVRLAAPLSPGDYALVLRPAFGKKYAGRDVLGTDGIGLVFSVAWPFTINK